MQKNHPREIGAFDAKTHLAELLRQVEAGEGFLITRRGKPIARLVPADPDRTSERAVAAARLAGRRARLPDLTDEAFAALLARAKV